MNTSTPIPNSGEDPSISTINGDSKQEVYEEMTTLLMLAKAEPTERLYEAFCNRSENTTSTEWEYHVEELLGWGNSAPDSESDTLNDFLEFVIVYLCNIYKEKKTEISFKIADEISSFMINSIYIITEHKHLKKLYRKDNKYENRRHYCSCCSKEKFA